MRAGAGGGARWFLVPAAAGVPLGLLWWWFAPTAQVQVARVGDDVLRYSAAVPELDAAQDVALLLPSVVFGLVTGLVVLLRGRASPSLTSALAAAGSLVGSGVALLVGRLLGPGAIPVPASEDAAPTTGLSPLELHSWGVLAAWAVVALLVMTTGHLAAAWSTRPDDDVPEAPGDAGDPGDTAVPGGAGDPGDTAVPGGAPLGRGRSPGGVEDRPADDVHPGAGAGAQR